jgi:NitT/TauT family transport system substrate-binding protein
MRPDPAGNPLPTRRLVPPRRLLLSRLLGPARKRLLIPAAAGVVALLAAACSSGGSGMGTVSGTITIAAAPGIDDAPLYLAQQKGLFAAAGLHVVIKDFGSQSAELAAVEGNQAQIAASDYGNIFALQQEKSNLRLLADGYDAGSGSVEILSLPKYQISSALNLQRSPIGLPSDSATGITSTGVPESLYVAAAREVMSNYLASGADTLTWQRMSQTKEISQLASGGLRAILLTEPYIYDAEASLGATPVLDVFSGGTANLPISGYVATNSWVKNNRMAIADFQSAIAQAQADAAQTGPIQQVLPKLPGAGISTQVANMVSIGSYPTSTNIGALQRVSELMTTESMLSKSGSIGINAMLVRPHS